MGCQVTRLRHVYEARIESTYAGRKHIPVMIESHVTDTAKSCSGVEDGRQVTSLRFEVV